MKNILFLTLIVSSAACVAMEEPKRPGLTATEEEKEKYLKDALSFLTARDTKADKEFQAKVKEMNTTGLINALKDAADAQAKK